MLARNETPPSYPCPESDDAVIARALEILRARMLTTPVLSSSEVMRRYLTLHLAGREAETFGCVFLSHAHQVIEVRDMFTGTLAQTSVYPREFVKAALSLNAGAVILYHNHPSGHAEPSRADESLTHSLQASLRLVDVHVLDHVVIGGADAISFAERGLL